jgi:hypothetical protein
MYGIFNSTFCASFCEKRLELKSFKRQTHTEDLGDPVPEFLSLRLSLKAFEFEPFLKKNSRKMAEPRVHRGGDGPSLKIYELHV